ncbi:MAG TPA: amidohydrolase family protein [Actinomycetota bacterium]|nr:amidohydrolase family protein [Actinomycetota bacterium]
MNVDALMLLGENRFGPSLGPQEALAVADRIGIDVIVAAPARPRDYHLGPANDALARFAAESGGRVIALGRVDPTDGARAVREAGRCLDELGCAGIFLHPGEEACPITQARNILEVAQRRRAPVVVAAGLFALSEPLQVSQVAAEFPETPVVMTNCGNLNISGLALADAWLAVTSTANLRVLTNGEYRQDFIERLAAADPERVLYGSMAPVFDPDFEWKRLSSARMSDEARKAIQGGNATRLFGLARKDVDAEQEQGVEPPSAPPPAG